MNVISKAIYNQVVSNYSLVSRIIENLRVLAVVSFFLDYAECKLRNRTFQRKWTFNPFSNSSSKWDRRWRYHRNSLRTQLFLQLPNSTRFPTWKCLIFVTSAFPGSRRSPSSPRYCARLLAVFPTVSFFPVRITFPSPPVSLRQASDLRSVIMLLASHPIVSISLDRLLLFPFPPRSRRGHRAATRRRQGAADAVLPEDSFRDLLLSPLCPLPT